MAFLALEKKNRKRFPIYISVCARERSFEASFTEHRENPGRAIETRRDSKTSFFENETIFAFITPRSRSNLTLKFFLYNARSLQENNARSAANQSARTIVAI